MTTSTTARRRPATGPDRDKEQHVDYRTTERILRSVQDGHIFRDIDYDYRDRRNNRRVNDAVYDAEKRGFLTLSRGGGIRVTDAGTAWLGRERLRGRKPAPEVTFTPPAVA